MPSKVHEASLMEGIGVETNTEETIRWNHMQVHVPATGSYQ